MKFERCIEVVLITVFQKIMKLDSLADWHVVHEGTESKLQKIQIAYFLGCVCVCLFFYPTKPEGKNWLE